ncbi:hypothetical protein LTR10_019392 [Elasticomyces elasticus]|uniref:Microbial-type PARG catalytic domain-containing protein n=1 Tax=Exophiala sideris TaxID=1016849 RepID=A0ABR0IVW6_9EURO|nr:hypothetical protein LTR10_019392 [Elasticomyces elasticus]KAK5021433.1 hypothetical protein LTS07_011043 [Exophiala sideris]KAK5025431.1 hypothetical protein LTR13_010508 [Exophiala sideris]KAK5049282.1 hypothetical protein LTR69_011067 [Exophiala sideris]KAK5176955.1 hypothetical protein LTR44_010528 [Eurotiomycetes sp. CCFEE 6388]
MHERSIRPRAYDNLPSERYQGRASFGEPPSKEKRKIWADKTLSMIATVLTDMGLSDQPDSKFFSSQLEQLKRDACPGYTLNPIQVRYGDTFTLTRQLLKTRPDYAGKVAVLNCASDTEVAGGWYFRRGTTQEDALCYSSTLWPTLARWRKKYPWRSAVKLDENPAGCAGIFSPNVVIFRDELSKDCGILARKDWAKVSVISVAALACPPVVRALTTRFGVESRMKLNNDARTIRERFRMILRMAAHHGKSVLVLAALGCGVWKCPPRQMAEMLKECLREPEFEGWFQEIWVGIYDEKVCQIWGEVFEDKYVL